LDLKPDQGSIHFKSRRMLLWDADAFGVLRQELIESVGVERARPILRRFGFANGYRDALTTGELFQWDNDEEWWLSCPALQRHEGKVYPEPKRLVVDRANGLFEMEVRWQNSYEAEQHVRIFGASDTPVCWTLTGFASGFSSALMGEEVFVVETECAAANGSHCRVEGKTKRAWGHMADLHGAEYKAKPLTEELQAREAELRRKNQALKRREREIATLRGSTSETRGGLQCRSRAMSRVIDLAETVARVDSTVLITGESGVGKERLARFLHDESQRADGPFLAVNCGALPETLLESTLFGHTRGSFTGADADRTGLFEAANGGTLFLDEIGDTSPATQVKLLRVLQEREVLPVGATAPRPTNVRVIAATNRDLETAVETDAFRKDLFYRLQVVEIEVPSLRERQEDILPLAREFIARSCRQQQQGLKTLSPEASQAITSHLWPGNVRELENAIERAVVLTGDGERIPADVLPASARGKARSIRLLRGASIVPIADIERRYVLEVLDHFRGNRTHTARALGIGANTLWRKLKGWGVAPARGPHVPPPRRRSDHPNN